MKAETLEERNAREWEEIKAKVARKEKRRWRQNRDVRLDAAEYGAMSQAEREAHDNL